MQVILFALAAAVATAQTPLSMYDTVMRGGPTGELTGFAQLVNSPNGLADFRNQLRNSQQMKTLFTPNNVAMITAGFDPSDAGGLTTARLQAHLLNGRYPTDSFPTGNSVINTALVNSTFVTLPNNQGSLLKVFRTDNQFRLDWGHPVNFATVTPANANIICSDGVIHIVNVALGVPPPMSEQFASHPSFSTFQSFIQQAGPAIGDYISNTAGITVFVPDNDAFLATIPNWQPPNTDISTLQTLARFHLIPSLTFFANMTNGACYQTVLAGKAGNICSSTFGTGVVRINDYQGRSLATLVPNEADIVTKNGVIQVLDRVMIPNLAFLKA